MNVCKELRVVTCSETSTFVIKLCLHTSICVADLRRNGITRSMGGSWTKEIGAARYVTHADFSRNDLCDTNRRYKLVCVTVALSPSNRCDICRTSNFQNTIFSKMLRLNSDWCLDDRSSRAVFKSQYFLNIYTNLIYIGAADNLRKYDIRRTVHLLLGHVSCNKLWQCGDHEIGCISGDQSSLMSKVP